MRGAWRYFAAGRPGVPLLRSGASTSRSSMARRMVSFCRRTLRTPRLVHEAELGVLVGVGGQPLQLEVFDSPRTLLHAWAPLLRAVASVALNVRLELVSW